MTSINIAFKSELTPDSTLWHVLKTAITHAIHQTVGFVHDLSFTHDTGNPQKDIPFKEGEEDGEKLAKIMGILLSIPDEHRSGDDPNGPTRRERIIRVLRFVKTKIEVRDEDVSRGQECRRPSQSAVVDADGGGLQPPDLHLRGTQPEDGAGKE